MSSDIQLSALAADRLLKMDSEETFEVNVHSNRLRDILVVMRELSSLRLTVMTNTTSIDKLAWRITPRGLEAQRQLKERPKPFPRTIS